MWVARFGTPRIEWVASFCIGLQWMDGTLLGADWLGGTNGKAIKESGANAWVAPNEKVPSGKQANFGGWHQLDVGNYWWVAPIACR